jgi:hypothetical protein
LCALFSLCVSCACIQVSDIDIIHAAM